MSATHVRAERHFAGGPDRLRLAGTVRRTHANYFAGTAALERLLPAG
jgi:hypothetical protein